MCSRRSCSNSMASLVSVVRGARALQPWPCAALETNTTVAVESFRARHTFAVLAPCVVVGTGELPMRTSIPAVTISMALGLAACSGGGGGNETGRLSLASNRRARRRRQQRRGAVQRRGIQTRRRRLRRACRISLRRRGSSTCCNIRKAERRCCSMASRCPRATTSGFASSSTTRPACATRTSRSPAARNAS